MRRRTGIVLATAGVAVIVLTGGVLAVSTHREPASHRTAAATTVVTARGDLVQAETVPGTLGYGPSIAINGRRSGTITWLPGAGATIKRGQTLWRVDDSPVVLLYGSIPLFRTLQVSGTAQTGRDVDLVAANLRALGFWHGGVDGARYDRYLAEAVKTWQRRLGQEADGVVHVGDTVVSSGAVRVDQVKAQIADPATGTVLTCTNRTRTIVLKVPVSIAQSLSRGTRIEATLPSGRTVGTRVTRIGGTATDGDSGGPPTESVVVRASRQNLLDDSALGDMTGRVLLEERHDVVSVPVAALLALAGGGYALERPDHRLVRVQVGLVADGNAEVSGIGAGVRVLVAS